MSWMIKTKHQCHRKPVYPQLTRHRADRGAMIDVSLGSALSRTRTYGMAPMSAKQNGAHTDTSPEIQPCPGMYPQFHSNFSIQNKLVDQTFFLFQSTVISLYMLSNERINTFNEFIIHLFERRRLIHYHSYSAIKWR